MKMYFVAGSQVPSETANSIQVMKVCQAFAQLGHAVTLLVPQVAGGPPDWEQLASLYGLETRFDVRWLPARSRRWFTLQATFHARASGAEAVYAWPVQSAVAALWLGLPVLLEAHELPTGRFGPWWHRLFLAWSGRKRLLPITDALRRRLEREYRPKLKDSQVVIAPDGVDLERYAQLPDAETARRQLGLASGTTVACTGHLYAGRGADLFLALAGRFPQVTFLWVGGRPQEVEHWRERAKASGLKNVRFTGFIPNRDLPVYQAAADVLLMPYGYSITGSSGGNTAEYCSPMKMFEYMATGRAIVTSDLPVLREVLDETTAVFCQPDDTAAWQQALDALLQDADRRAAMGRQALSDVVAYTWVERARRSLEGF